MLAAIKRVYSTIKPILMSMAEIFDALRIFPRGFVIMYGVMVYKLFTWYQTIKPTEKVECNDRIVSAMLEKGIDPMVINDIACRVTDMIGGPTMEQTAFVTTICGLAAIIFNFYTNTGKKWSKDNSKADDIE